MFLPVWFQLFLLAGAMVNFINREAILKYLGEKTGRIKSFFLAGFSSFFLAACSCTVIPIAGGLFYSGAGIGPAFIILWVAPAANILALLYTGTIIGGEMVLARLVSALLMAFIVGLIMTWSFDKENNIVEQISRKTEESNNIVGKKEVIFMLLILSSLLLPNYLIRSGPNLNKVLLWLGLTVLIGIYGKAYFPRLQISAWLRESWWFIRMIFPFLLVGVFFVGVVGKIIPEEWVKNYLGGNGLLASFLATMIGAVSYFAIMTEAPFVDTLMKLGMGKGPALALLLTGPGLSLPNWLAIARVFGVKKAIVYVLTIVVLGTIVGWFTGNFYF